MADELYGNEDKNLSSVEPESPLTAQEWRSCVDELPDDRLIVMTKISDGAGERNEQLLKRQGRLWFVPSGDMYVYYSPTHWRSATADELLGVRKEFEAREEAEHRLINELDRQLA